MNMRSLLQACLHFALLAGSCSIAVGTQSQSILPDSLGQVMLIKNTIAAVNHGNITGNYTVLRDLASERFRQQNTSADLAKTFANLREKKFDLSPILVVKPQLTQPPAEDSFRGRLQLVGYFPTRPQAVQFALTFQRTEKGWMIDEITVAIATTTPTTPVVPVQTIRSQDLQRLPPSVIPRP